MPSQNEPFLEQGRVSTNGTAGFPPNTTLDIVVAAVCNTAMVLAQSALVLANAHLSFNNTESINYVVYTNGTGRAANIEPHANTTYIGNQLNIVGIEAALGSSNAAFGTVNGEIGTINTTLGTYGGDIAAIDAALVTTNSAFGTVNAIASASYATANSANAASGVGAGTYGDATHVSQVTVDARGKVTALANIAITAGIISSSLTANNGYIEFGNGVIIKWGQFTTIDGTVTVNFSPVFPTNCYAVQIQQEYTDSAGHLLGRAPNHFQYAESSSVGICNYIAVGF